MIQCAYAQERVGLLRPIAVAAKRHSLRASFIKHGAGCDQGHGEADLAEDWTTDAINSLCMVFAADESVRTGQVVRL
jgi:hypothetical protein